MRNLNLVSRVALVMACVFFNCIVEAAQTASKAQVKQSSKQVVQRPPLEIKAIKIGMSITDLKRLFGSSAICYSAASCQVSMRLAEKAAVFQTSFTDDKLDNAYLSKYESTDVEALVEAFRQKYGEPDNVFNRVLQNGFGAKFECPVYTWNFPDGNLMVARYRPEIRELMQIEITSAELMKKKDVERKKAIGDV